MEAGREKRKLGLNKNEALKNMDTIESIACIFVGMFCFMAVAYLTGCHTLEN